MPAIPLTWIREFESRNGQGSYELLNTNDQAIPVPPIANDQAIPDPPITNDQAIPVLPITQ